MRRGKVTAEVDGETEREDGTDPRGWKTFFFTVASVVTV